MPSLLRSAFCGLFTLLAVQGCARARVTPDPPLLASSDYIQLEYGGPKVLPQTIRIFADGRMVTDTSVVWAPDFALGCPLRPEDQESSISRQEADSLIYSANQAGFFMWDSLYRAKSIVLDAGSSRITLRIGNNTHQVTVHAGNPPDTFFRLEERIRTFAPIPEYAQYRSEPKERQQYCEHLSRSALIQAHHQLFPPA